MVGGIYDDFFLGRKTCCPSLRREACIVWQSASSLPGVVRQHVLLQSTYLLHVCACVRCFFQVRIITSNNCLSAGDALRDIDQRGVVRSDPFILVSGDVISNIDLKSVMKQVYFSYRPT